MTARKLNPDQIQEMFTFCYKKNVKEYEIQAELVDHLASSIETLQEEQSNICFQDALNHAYAKFGSIGFNELVKSKKRAFRHQYDRLFLKFLITFFRLPRIILTLALILVLFTLIRIVEPTKIIITYAIVALFSFHIWHSKSLGIPKLGIKSFLLENYFNQLKSRATNLIYGFYFFFLLFIVYFPSQETVWFDFLISSLLALIFIYYYNLMFYMTKLVKQHFQEQFPQFVKL